MTLMPFDYLLAAGPRPRVSAVILRNSGREILMVRHLRKDGSSYWQLPGGGLQSDESAEDGLLREVLEETGLQGRVVRWLFTIPYRLGISSTFLVEVNEESEAELGIDPEEINSDHRKLVGLAWRPVDAEQDGPEVRVMQLVLSYLDQL